jgi:hypothetical protein
VRVMGWPLDHREGYGELPGENAGEVCCLWTNGKVVRNYLERMHERWVGL